MNDFKKDELELIVEMIDDFFYSQKEPSEVYILRNKIESMIDNYCENENADLIGTGQLLFHNKESSTAILPKIGTHIDLCENSEETKCFRIDWKILYGKKFI